MSRRILYAFVLLIGLIARSSAQTTRVWSGASATTNNWSDPTNWVGGTAPTAGDALVFDGTGVTAGSDPWNDFTAGTAFASITVRAAGYMVSGNRIVTSGGLFADTYTSGESTVAVPLEGAGRIRMAAAGRLTVWADNTLLTGPVEIWAGTLVGRNPGFIFGVNANLVFGTGTIVLGKASDAAPASLYLDGGAILNPIVLATGTTGALTIGALSGNGVVFMGSVTGQNDVTLDAQSHLFFCDSHLIPGCPEPFNISGRITMIGPDEVNIEAPIGPDVTALTIANSGFLNGIDSVEIGGHGLTITKTGPARVVIDVVHGPGDLVIHNNAANNLQLFNPKISGTITNAGTGTGQVSMIVIGSTVTRVIQNGASKLSVQNASQHGALDVLSGEYAGSLGTGTVTLGSVGGGDALLTLKGGTQANPIVLASGATGTLTIGGTSTSTLTGGVTGTNNLTISASDVTFSSIPVNNRGSVTNAASVLTIDQIGSNVTSIVQSGNDRFTVNTLTVNTAGTAVKSSNGAIAAFNVGGVIGTGNVTFSPDGNQNIAVTGSVNNIGLVTVAGSGNGTTQLHDIGGNVTEVSMTTAAARLAISGTNSLAGPFTVASGATVHAPSSAFFGNGSATNTLILAGTLVADGAITSPATRPITLTGTGTFDTNGNAVEIDGPVSGAGSLTKTGAGTLSINGAATIGGNVTVSQGTLGLSSASLFNVGGSITNNGEFPNTNGTVVLNGSAPQTIGGANTMFFGNLTINNAAGVTIATSPTVEGVLTLTAGRVTTGANKVTVVAGDFVAGGSASSYVNGTLERGIPSMIGPTLVFPIGDATAYAPVTVAFSGLSVGPGKLSATTTAGDHPDLGNSGLDPAKSVNRYWTLTKTGPLGLTYAATFTFPANEMDAGTNANSFLVRKNTVGTWSAPTIGARTATSVQATGLTGFSDFVVGQLLIANASISSTTPAVLTETNLNGATVVVDLVAGLYGASLATTDFALSSAPAGTSIAGVTRNSGTRATLTLARPAASPDFDVDASLAVDVLQSALANGAGPATTPSVTVAAVLETAVSIQSTTPQLLTEPALNGATVNVSLIDGTFAASLTPANFSFGTAPAGLTIGAVTRTSATTATLTLAFAGDFDVNTSFSIRVEPSALATGVAPVTSGPALVAAVLETALAIQSTSPASLTEPALNGATVTLLLNDGTFAASLAPANFALATAPAGVTIGAVARTSATTATLTLAFTGADFDVDTPLSVRAEASALATGVGPVTTAPITVVGVLETTAAIQSTSPATLTEPALNGASLVVSLVDATFAASPAPSSFTLIAPAGVTIGAATRTSATTATLTLAFTGDFDADATLAVRVEAAALATGVAPVTTATVPVHAVVETGAIIASTSPSVLTESTLPASTITIDLTAGAFAPALAPASFALNGLPGPTVRSVARVSDTRATLTLAFDGTDFDDTRSLSVTVLAAAFTGGATATTGTVPITGTPADHAALSGLTSLLPNVMSAPITLTLLEPNGTGMHTPVPRVFQLATSATNGKFWADAAGTREITSITIDGMAWAAVFYYRDANPGEPVITATGAGFPAVTARPTVARVTTLAFEPLPDSVPADLAITPAIVVRAVDRQGATDTTFAGDILLVVKERPAASTMTDTLRATAVKGVATFRDAHVDAAGAGYVFEARGASGEPPAIRSAPVRAFLAPVSVSAEIAIDKSNPMEGDTVTVVLSLTNNTGARALDVVYDVPSPERTQFISASPSVGAFDRGTSKWTIATLEKNARATLTLTLIVKAQP